MLHRFDSTYVYRSLSVFAVYLVLGLISLLTAYVETNTAAVWMATGFSIGVLTTFGLEYWPAVALGAFVVNLLNNLVVANLAIVPSFSVAGAIAVGNAAEAFVASWLIRSRHASASILTRPQHFVMFAGLTAIGPPLISTLVGIEASRLGHVPAVGTTVEIAATWYLANALGILLIAPLVIAIVEGQLTKSWRERPVELVFLVACLLFAGQAMNGRFLAVWLQPWPRAYMVMPLMLWAAFRFGTSGALVSILLIAAESIIGTTGGFAVFPAATPSRSLIYLQLYLAFLSVTTLTVTSALAELEEMRLGLEGEVRVRTAEVMRLLEAQSLTTNLVVHELRSPLLGVRNMLRAAATAFRNGSIERDGVSTALSEADQTCSALAEKALALLPYDQARDAGETTDRLSAIIDRIIGLQSSQHSRSRFTVTCDSTIKTRDTAAVEHILGGLITNALHHGPPDHSVTVQAFEHGGTLEVLVTDSGRDVQGRLRTSLLEGAVFRPTRSSQAGLGLRLISEQAAVLGGRLSYLSDIHDRTVFRLRLPRRDG